MGLFDFLSGSDEAERAAEQNRAQLAQYGTQSAGQLADYTTTARGDISSGVGKAAGALGTGVGQAVDAYNKGIAAYTPLSNLGANYGQMVQLYQDALGANGPAGTARAQSAFTASPGYEFTRGEALRDITNQASRYGGSGGNTLTALENRAAGLAGNEYQAYLNRLQGFVAPQLQALTSAAQGTAGIYGDIGQTYTGQGRTLSDLYSGEGQNLANVQGNLLTGQLGVGRDITSGNIAANNLVAQAGMQDAANAWGAIDAGIGAVGRAFGGRAA